MPGEIETGYEPSFDFPTGGEPPSLFYMIATVPRTGSTWLSHLLWGTGCLGAPLEYLNFEGGPFAHAMRDAEEQQRIWQAAVRGRTSSNGVFGVKCFPVQLQNIGVVNPPLLDEVMRALLSRRRVVYLLRRDRIAHTASFARASLSGVWREEQETGQRHDYSAEALASVEIGINVMANLWEAMFRDLKIEPLRLFYEDALADPAGTVAKVAAYLGVPIDPAAAIPVPEVRKQSAPDIADWAARYARSRSGLPG